MALRLTFGKLFVVSQVALSLLLLIGAGLFVRSLRNLQQVDAGFARENVLVTKLEPVGSHYKTPQLAARYDELLRRLEAIPGVRQASLVGYSPMSRREWLVMGQSPEWVRHPMSVQGYTPQPGEEMTIPWMQVYPNSFATLDIPLVAGRDFGPQDAQVWRPGTNVHPLRWSESSTKVWRAGSLETKAPSDGVSVLPIPDRPLPGWRPERMAPARLKSSAWSRTSNTRVFAMKGVRCSTSPSIRPTRALGR